MSDKILDLIHKELEELWQHKANVESVLAEIKEQEKRLYKMIGVYEGNPTKKTKSTSVRNVPQKPPQGADAVLEHMRNDPDAEFTASYLVEETDLTQSTVNRILVYLREHGDIDLVRVGGQTGQTKFYKAALSHASTE